MRALFLLAMLTMSSSASRIDASDPVPVSKGSQHEGSLFQEAEERRPIDGEAEKVVRVENRYETRDLFQEADERRENDEGAVKNAKVKHRMSIECAEKSYSAYQCYRGYRYGCSRTYWKCWKSTRGTYYYFDKENEHDYVKCNGDGDCLAHWKALEAAEPLDQPCDYATSNAYPCRYGRRYGCDKNVSPHKCWLTRYQNDNEKMYVKHRLKKSCQTNDDCDPARFSKPFDFKCGKRKVARRRPRPGSMRMRIVGGNNTVRGYIPWQVSIRDTAHRCGGTIIDRKWILTARHCVEKKDKSGIWIHLDASDLTVKAGKIERDNAEDGDQTVPVEKIFRYPLTAAFEQSVEDLIRQLHPTTPVPTDDHDYERLALIPDVALLKLAKELHFGNYAQPACLPSPANEFADYALGNRVIVSGWGKDGISPNNITRFLQVAKLPIIWHDICVHAPIRKFCAANWVVGGVGVCYGDSGGPVVKKVGGRFTVLGVIETFSHYNGHCGEPGGTSLFAKVAYYVDWINQTVHDNDNIDYLSYYTNRRDQEEKADVMID